MKLLSALALLFIGPIVLAAGINFIGWLGGKIWKEKARYHSAEFGPILSRGLNIDLLKKSVRFL